MESIMTKLNVSTIDKIEEKTSPPKASSPLEKLRKKGRVFPTERGGIPSVGTPPSPRTREDDTEENIARFEDEGGFVSMEEVDGGLTEYSKQKLYVPLPLAFNRHPL